MLNFVASIYKSKLQRSFLIRRTDVDSGGRYNFFNQGLVAAILRNKNFRPFLSDMKQLYQVSFVTY